MYGISSQMQMVYASGIMGGAMGMSQLSPAMMQRLMQMLMLMQMMGVAQGGMPMPMMMPGMMAGGMQNIGAMGMIGGLGTIGGATPYGMSAYGSVGMVGGMMMGGSISSIMGGGVYGGMGIGGMWGGVGMMGEMGVVGGVGMFGFRNRIENDPFGSGGAGMGGNRKANLANSPEVVLALDNIFKANQGKSLSFDEVAKQLKEKYGIEGKVETVDGKKTLKFANGDYISDSNGNNVLEKSEYDFDGALKQIKQNYGIDSAMFDQMYNVQNRGGIPAQFGANVDPANFYGPKFLGGGLFGMGSQFGISNMFGVGGMFNMFSPMLGMFGNAYAYAF